jgi:hypothetical protein
LLSGSGCGLFAGELLSWLEDWRHAVSDEQTHFHITEWPALMNCEQAASYLSIGVSSLKKLVADDSIEPVRIPGCPKSLKFRRYELDKFIESLDRASSSKAIRERQKFTEAARAAVSKSRSA